MLTCRRRKNRVRISYASDVGFTGQGTILGTLQYMSPEQVEGREADSRSDIFGFGATLYEMVTGVKAFEGQSQMSVMASILEHEPRPMRSLLPVAPPLLERVVRKCLAKDPNSRWQSAADLIEALEWVKSGSGEAAPAVGAPPTNGWKTLAVSAVILAVIAGLLAALLFLRKTNDDPLWVSVIPPDSNFSVTSVVALSPDGKQIIVAAPNSAGTHSLWVRSIHSADARELPGTTNGILPFWSPDGKSIGFFNFTDGKLERIDIAGGVPQVLAPAANPRGATWGADGTILFVPAPTSELLKVPASGGAISPWKASFSELVTYEAPHFLPDGKHFLYFVLRTDSEKQGLYVGSLETGESKRITGVSSRGEYVNGYLFFCKGPDLFAQPFDLAKLELQGEARRIASNIGYNYGDMSNRAFSVAAGGTLAYTSQLSLTTAQLTWFDRAGKQLDRLGGRGLLWIRGVTRPKESRTGTI